jgi:hypothetical protein
MKTRRNETKAAKDRQAGFISLLTVQKSPLSKAQFKEGVNKILIEKPMEVGLFLAIEDVNSRIHNLIEYLDSLKNSGSQFFPTNPLHNQYEK